MVERFDPYLQWLGIRDRERPPDHYRLLGVDPFESDPEVLTHAADRQMAHVRTFQTGKHSAESQRLLNELAAAKICLLNPEKKTEYDARLRVRRGEDARVESSAASSGTAEPPTAAPPAGAGGPGVAADEPPPLPAGPVSQSLATGGSIAAPLAPTAAERPARESSPWVSCAITVLGAMVVALVGLILLFSVDWQEERESGNSRMVTAREAPPEPRPDIRQPDAPEPDTPQPDTPQPGTSQPGVPQSGTLEPDTPEPGTLEPDTPEPDTPEPDAPEPGTPQRPEDKRLAIPAPADQEKMREEIRGLFAEDYASAKERAQICDLAGMLLQKAMETKDDPVARYVLLTEARDQAVAAGDTRLFRSTLHFIGKEYRLDWLVVAAETLGAAAKKSREADVGKALAHSALDLTQEAIRRADFDTAAILAEAARDSARNIRRVQDRDLELIKRAVALMNEVTVLRQQHEEFLEAEKILAERPDDPGANWTAGKYLCLVQGDFRRGLPMLLRSNDAVLAPLAEAELSRPTAAAEMVALGHRWWDAAEEAEQAQRRSFQDRASHWYLKALPGLSGLTRTKVEHRLAELRDGSSGGRN